MVHVGAIRNRLTILPDDVLDLRSATTFAVELASTDNQHALDTSLFKARKILETVLREKYKQAKGCSQKDRRLETLINVAWKECGMPRHLKVRAEHIREMGNASVHEEIPLTASDVVVVFDYLVDILEWYFELPSNDSARQQQYESFESEQRPATSGVVHVVPKGLRSFDGADRSFFLRLLPGPYDENGLPDSIRFWLNRIEGRVHDSFSVGVVYGPSGGGKSSLIKAGLLPCLSERVHVVYLEATQHNTESTLLSRICRALRLSEETELQDLLRRIRGGEHLPAGEKLLLVIDQFEQRLHGTIDDHDAELSRALRECDGERIQCLLIVRDDYWTPIDRFTESLDLTLAKGRNLRRVDLFSLEHARHVLELFGRAYGRFSGESLTRSQQEFLKSATEVVAEDGKVIPVRLSLFADMIRNKPWTAETVVNAGGSEGIGVAFLEDTFASKEAHPGHRRHEEGARRVLGALVPGPGKDIKGSMRSRSELQKIAGYRSDDFDRLLHILDAELKLITLSGHDAPADNGDSEQISEPHYQLTHDYLVPALREWLTRKLRETSRGRAQLRLAGYEAIWKDSPIDQYLPTFRHWISIRWLVPARYWSADQRAMMKRAGRYYGVRSLLVVLLLLLIGFASREGYGRYAAMELQSELFAADDLGHINRITRELQQYRQWAVPSLLEATEYPDENSNKRKAMLGLRPVYPGAVDYFADELLAAPRVAAIREACQPLLGYETTANGRLWDEFESATDERRFAALIGLINLDPPRTNSRWDRSLDAVVETLVYGLGHVDDWVDRTEDDVPDLLGNPELAAFQPLKAALRKVVERNLESTEAKQLAAAWFTDDPEFLSSLVADASRDELPFLTTSLERDRDAAVQSLETQLRALTTKQPVPESAEDAVAEFDGLINENGAFCASVPADSIREITAVLGESGYRPVKLRPFSDPLGLQVCVVWTKDPVDWKLETELSRERLLELNEQYEKEGFYPVDACAFPDTDSTLSDSGPSLFAAVWGRGKKEGADVMLGVTRGEMSQRLDALIGADGYVYSMQCLQDQNGNDFFTALGSLDPLENAAAVYLGDSSRILMSRDRDGTSGRDFLDLCMFDLAIADKKTLTARKRWEPSLAHARRSAETQPESKHEWTVSAELCALYHLERFEELVELGQSYLASEDLAKSQTGSAHYWTALGAMQLGQLKLAKLQIRLYDELGYSTTDYLDPLLLFYQGRDEEADTALRATLEKNPADNGYNVACVYALAAQRLGDSDASRQNELKQAAMAALHQSRFEEWTHAVTDFDLKCLRDMPEFVELLTTIQATPRFSAIFADREGTSTAVFGLNPRDHARRSQELMEAGMSPVSVSSVWDAAQKTRIVSSTWFGPATGAEEPSEQKRQRQIVNMCCALLELDQPRDVWNLVKHSANPTIRTAILQRRSEMAGNHELLIRELKVRPSPDHLPAVIAILSECDLATDELQSAAQELQRLLKSPSAAISRSAASCLRNMKQEFFEPLRPESGNRWYRTKHRGHTMVVIDSPELQSAVTCAAGDSTPIRPFAISAFRVSPHQLLGERRFDGSSKSVSWYEAVEYCRILSRAENIPEDQRCYPSTDRIKPGMVLPAQYLERTGYRLPTAAEWEVAVRCGVVTEYPWGSQPLASLPDFREGASRHSLTPLNMNKLGICGILSQKGEWCHDSSGYYGVFRTNEATVPQDRERVVTGFLDGFSVRQFEVPGSLFGFRVARTLPILDSDSRREEAGSLFTGGGVLDSDRAANAVMVLDSSDLSSTDLSGAKANDDSLTIEEMWQRLEDVKVRSLDWDGTKGDARKWWEAFEEENKTRIRLVLKVARELEDRNATITDFFLAYVYSDTDNIQAVLSYLDYTRQMKAAEAKKESSGPKPLDTEQFGWNELTEKTQAWWLKHWADHVDLHPGVERLLTASETGLADFYRAHYSFDPKFRPVVTESDHNPFADPGDEILFQSIAERFELLKTAGLLGTNSRKTSEKVMDMIRTAEDLELELAVSLAGADTLDNPQLWTAVDERLNDATEDVTRIIVTATRERGLPAALQERILALLTAKLADSQDVVPAWVIDQLSLRAGDEEDSVARQAMRQFCANGSSAESRAYVVKKLARLSRVDAETWLEIMARVDDESPVVRVALAQAIGRNLDSSRPSIRVILPLARYNQLNQTLGKLLRDDDLSVVLAAAQAVQNSGADADSLIDAMLEKLSQVRQLDKSVPELERQLIEALHVVSKANAPPIPTRPLLPFMEIPELQLR